ncbi:MAG: nematocidal protein AidA [Euryarchaeota archaeon]|jgi:nematocidal protein AidA|nr:nematocidal protein AidA [Euryarchaeota archaeon]
MATIDILVSIDTETILNTYGHSLDPQNPVLVPNNPNLIYMIVKNDSAVSGQAAAELNIRAETMDTIRWRATSLSLNSDSEVILISYSGAPALISQPQPLIATVNCPLPNPNDPNNPTTQTIKSYFFNSTVLDPGVVTYHFVFLIIDRHGTKKGYYHWDPFITITA